MRYLFSVLTLLISILNSSAQKFSFPKIINSGKDFDSFVPKGWAIKDTVTGDLNKDGLKDAAIVIEDQDSVKEISRDTTIDGFDKQCPRILIILFRAGGHYELQLQQNTFILRNGERGLSDYDPYNGMAIAKGVLIINFDILYRDVRHVLNYTVRYQSGDFYLIGATSEESNNSGTTSSDFNFSTRKYIYQSSGPAGSNQKDEYEVKKFLLPKLKKLSELNEPFEWQVFDNELI